MHVSQSPRSLRALVGLPGVAYRCRALPPASAYVLLLGLLAAVLVSGASYLPMLAIVLLLLCGGMVQRMAWSCRFGCWQWVAGLMLLLFQPGWSGLDIAVFACFAVGCVLIAIGQVVVATWRIGWLSQQIQWAVDAMSDVDILALLPAFAAEDARLWLAGDDRKQAELASVISLSVLHAALASVPVPKAVRLALFG